HHAQTPAVLDHSCALPQGDGSTGLALAGGAEGGERDLIVLNAGDVLDDAFAIRCPGIYAEGEVSSQRAHLRPLLPHPSSSSRYMAWRVGQALAPKAIAERLRSGGVWEAESNIDLLDLVPASAAADWDASFTVECIHL